MGVNKNQLQVNNGDLSGILSYIDQMAVGGEDLTEEVLAQPPLVAQIMALAGRKAGVEKEGLYVWGKYEYSPEVTVENPQFHITTAQNEIVANISDASFDCTRIAELPYSELCDFFSDVKDKYAASGYPKFIKTNAKLWFSTTSVTASEIVSFTAISESTGYFTFAAAIQVVNDTDMYYNGSKIIPDQKTFLTYVTADYEDVYPDGAVDVDGYWYEKVVEGYSAEDLGFTEMCVDTLVYATDTNTYQLGVPHSLGKVPSGFLIVASEKVSTANHIRYSIGFNSLPYYESTERGIDGILSVYSSSSYNGTYGETEGASNTGYVDNLTLNTNKNNLMFAAGVEYKLITWA